MPRAATGAVPALGVGLLASRPASPDGGSSAAGPDEAAAWERLGPAELAVWLAQRLGLPAGGAEAVRLSHALGRDGVDGRELRALRARPGCGAPCCGGGWATAVARLARNRAPRPTRRCCSDGASCWRRRWRAMERWIL